MRVHELDCLYSCVCGAMAASTVWSVLCVVSVLYRTLAPSWLS